MEGEWDGLGQMRGWRSLVLCHGGFIPFAQRECVPRYDVFLAPASFDHIWEVFSVKINFWLKDEKAFDFVFKHGCTIQCVIQNPSVLLHMVLKNEVQIPLSPDHV